MTLLRSLLFALLFYPGTLVYVLTVIAVSPIGDRPVQAVVHAWSAFHNWLVRNVVGIRIEWDGQIPDGAYLIAVKHQSMMEAVDTLHFANTPVVVMKRELTVIPLFGWVTRRYGVIGVDRDAGASALRAMMVEAKAAIAGGRPVIIFPEGTRVAYGESPAAAAGLCRPLPGAGAARRAGGARCRPAVAQGLPEAVGNRPFQGWRSHSVRPQARRKSKRGCTAAINALNP